MKMVVRLKLAHHKIILLRFAFQTKKNIVFCLRVHVFLMKIHSTFQITEFWDVEQVYIHVFLCRYIEIPHIFKHIQIKRSNSYLLATALFDTWVMRVSLEIAYHVVQQVCEIFLLINSSLLHIPLASSLNLFIERDDNSTLRYDSMPRASGTESRCYKKRYLGTHGHILMDEPF